MAAMTNLPVPAGDTWTLAYTASGAKTIKVQNRSPSVGLMVRVDGSAGATDDSPDAAAMQVHPHAILEITLATSDKVYCRALGAEACRATVLA
jgi:hypothetical protein